ncbi:hypothetical protein [Aliiroseovarius sp. F20344]|uniref:hypothetical protein n=1 Tax=Aliiroseovarius sp. F20344 TaxID=2926414 RepID=UPI001FF4435B|nr:hypothetical protein [Aliiroseovarius sp. F20344]MCK0141820.1 hypothetical protein [Aliiroseovarius sp. F20344]
MRILLQSCVFILLSMPLAAQPTYGTLIGERDGDTLNYECRELSADTIECEFVQILMSKDTPEHVSKEAVDQILADMNTESTEEVCGDFKRVKAILDGKADRSIWPEKSDEEIEAILTSVRSAPFGLASLKALSDLCETPTDKAAARFIEVSNQSKDVVCKPLVNKYTQNFVRVSPKTWVVKSEPSGACGLVNTSKFVGHPEFGSLWSYYASKVVTNKDGKGLVDCNELDEREQPYKWDQGPVYKNCQYFD